MLIRGISFVANVVWSGEAKARSRYRRARMHGQGCQLGDLAVADAWFVHWALIYLVDFAL